MHRIQIDNTYRTQYKNANNANEYYMNEFYTRLFPRLYYNEVMSELKAEIALSYKSKD